jgi:basic amino acid/polyamine antiporter, APA family
MKNPSKHQISAFGLTMVVVGACIGSGIFATPQSVAAFIGDEFYVLLAWLIGGGIVLTGALTYSELAGLFPSAGGVYVYLKEAFGKRFAFLYGWSVLTVITSGSVAAIAFVCSTYSNQLLGGALTDAGILSLTIGIIVFNTIVHVLGIKIGELFNNVLAVVKVAGILLLVLFGIYFSISLELISIPESASEQPMTSGGIWTGIALSMIPILWSFGGFQHATFLAGDAKNARKSVPRAMIVGIILVTLLYVLVNYTFIQLMGMDSLSKSERPAYDAFKDISSQSSFWISLLIVISTFGSAFIFTMSAPRIYYAMAKDEVFFQFLAKRHKKFDTPANAIILQSAWAIVLVLFWQTFNDLINYVTFLEWIFLMMAGLAVFKFRSTTPRENYLFRMPFYPILPIIFGMAVVGFLAVVLSSGNKPALYGMVLLLAGVMAYELYKRFK